jgi:multidrug resistance efflux pump
MSRKWLVVLAMLGMMSLVSMSQLRAQSQPASAPAATVIGLSPATVQVVEVLAQKGQRVQAGDVLVRLDCRDLELELARAEAELRLIETEFKVAMSQPDRMADAQLRRAQMDVKRAEIEAMRYRVVQRNVCAAVDGVVVDMLAIKGATVREYDVLYIIEADQ